MKVLYILPAVILAVVAEKHHESQVLVDTYPEWYMQRHPRQRRDYTLSKEIGDDGRVFGTLGSDSAGLFGKAGYDHKIFDDDRGKLNAEAYGTRVLGAAGDSTKFGGALKWENPNAAATFDINRQIGGDTSYKAGAGGKWPIGKDGDFSFMGTYGRQGGMSPNYGGMANFNYRW